MPACVEGCLRYLAVLVVECLKVINKVNEEAVHNDLLVDPLGFSCFEANQVLPGCPGEGED